MSEAGTRENSVGRSEIEEIHHQVGNSFQTMSSLMGLIQREKKLLNQEVQRKINCHVQTLADLHHIVADQVRKGIGSGKTADVGRLAERIVDRFSGFFPARIETTGISGSFVPFKSAMSFGLVCNELLDNACKFGDGAAKVGLIDMGSESVFSVSNLCKESVDLDSLRRCTTGGLGIVQALIRSRFSTGPKFSIDAQNNITVSFAIDHEKRS